MKYKCDCGHEFEYQESDIKSHYVMCGDSTKIEDVEKLMDGKKADMVFTDPPYGMDLDTDYSAMSNSEGKSNKYSKVIGDSTEWDFNKSNFFDCKEQFWWGADYYRRTLPISGSFMVWDKRESESTGKNVDKRFGSMFELCWSKQNHKREIIRIMWAGMMGVKDDSKRVHPTQKPVQLADWFINKFSKENEIIIDIFLGSGSTLIACEQTNRICYGMEIDEKYCDVIRKRYAKFIGKEEEWQEATPRI